MAWKDVIPARQCGAAGRGSTPQVTVSRRAEKSGRPRLNIGLTGPLLVQPGWKKGGTVAVQHDAEGGRLRLAAPGPWYLSGKKQEDLKGASLSITFDDVAVHRAQVAAHTIEDGALIVTLPDWAAPARKGVTPAAEAPVAPRAKPPFSMSDSIPDPLGRTSAGRPRSAA